MKNIEDFVSQLIISKGFEENDPEVLEQIKQDLISRVEDRINAMIVSNLNPEKLLEFEKILDSHNEDAILNFVKTDIPNIEEKVAAELLEFKNIYLG